MRLFRTGAVSLSVRYMETSQMWTVHAAACQVECWLRTPEPVKNMQFHAVRRRMLASCPHPRHVCLTCLAAAPAPCHAQVLGALQQTADALGMTGDAFLTTFNKSVPTALGLLGEGDRQLPHYPVHPPWLCHSAPLLRCCICACADTQRPRPPAAIPFIVHPIDAGVHAVLNATLRPAMRRYICDQAGGREAGLLICQRCQE